MSRSNLYRAKAADGVAWVTGASRGIGRAVALELVRRGWRVACTALDEPELQSLRQEARADSLFCFPCDVTDRAAMNALTLEIERSCGPIALAFINAGGLFEDPPGVWIGDHFRRTLDLNCGGALNSLESVLPGMLERKKGQIAMMASMAGYIGLPKLASYCMSKAALIVLCESLYNELQNCGLRLQVVCPGFVDTGLTASRGRSKPFLLSPEDAARRICDGFERGAFEIAFPRRLRIILKVLHLFPYSILFGFVAWRRRRRLRRRLSEGNL